MRALRRSGRPRTGLPKSSRRSSEPAGRRQTTQRGRGTKDGARLGREPGRASTIAEYVGGYGGRFLCDPGGFVGPSAGERTPTAEPGGFRLPAGSPTRFVPDGEGNGPGAPAPLGGLLAASVCSSA